MKAKILIVDDEKPTRDAMSRVLRTNYDCLTAADAESALKVIASTPDIALMLTDYRMEPGDNGIQLMRKAKEISPSLGCILITAFGEIDLAVKAMREGADDFLTKPITDIDQLEARVAQAIKTRDLPRETTAVDATQADGLRDFTGRSPTMERVYRLIRKVAPTNATVLIEGPSGSGKELTARALHRLSARANGPFVAVECAALPATLLETELFGAVKGAFTDARDRPGCFETANGGTLFLDEIGEIDLSTQVKLLRVLETHTFQRVGESVNRKSDFRLVVATNRDLAKQVADGKFREDLFYRLNVIDIRTPALREHHEDIPLLVEKFIQEYATANHSQVTGIAPDALRALENYSWPGNVRQLRNVIEKMIVLATGPQITTDDLPPEIKAPVQPDRRGTNLPDEAAVSAAIPPVASATPQATPAGLSLAETEKAKILATLDACRGNKSKAALQLGISRRTLHRKLNEWRIS